MIKGSHYKKNLNAIARKVMDGTATEDEKRFLDAYYDFFAKPHNTGNDLSDEEEREIYLELKNRINNTGTGKVRRMFVSPMRIAAAVALLTLAAISAYQFLSGSNADKAALVKTAPVKSKPILHGGTKATLTLADGTLLELDELSAGKLTQQAGLEISKTADGQLVYKSSKVNDKDAENQFNTMQTPRGGIYQVVLPDGTRVWLNSASTLKYPLAFSKAERKVELEGEAYFEVAHRDKQPFRVASANQTVEVLGTHFNVYSYKEESRTKTTLLQGSVKVLASGNAVMLKPGQEAINKASGIKVKEVDAENAIAWKDGLFRFDNEDVHTIMNKIGRWYDVEIVYQDDVDDIHFGGSVSRFSDISKLLNKLELTNAIHFKIEGRRIIVMK